MRARSSIRPGVPSIAGLAVFAALLVLFTWRHFYCLYDDAFIYLRYVKNVRDGCGLRWNCEDPRVEGFSSPLHLLFLLFGSLFTTRLVVVAEIVSSLAVFAAGGLAIHAAAASFHAPRTRLLAALAMTALLGLDHRFLLNAVIGMDSAVAAAAVMATFLLVDARRGLLAAAGGVVSVLARPEALVFALLVPLFVPRRDRVRAAVVTAAGLAAIVLARRLIFDDVLPNTYWAKAGGTAVHARLGAEYLGLFVLDFPIVLLAPLALRERRRRAATAFALAGSAVWCAAFLRTGGDTFAYSRLGVPLVPMLAVLALRGSFALVRRPIAGVPALAIAGAAALGHHLPAQHGFENVLAWTATGRWLAKHHPGETVATVPIGAIGYFSKLRVIDLVGLTDRTIAHGDRTVPPELLVREWVGHERHDLAHVAELRPDVVVTTKYRAEPWRTLDEASAGFYADWLFLRAMKSGELPYRIADAEVLPGVHWLIFVRDRPPE